MGSSCFISKYNGLINKLNEFKPLKCNYGEKLCLYQLFACRPHSDWIFLGTLEHDQYVAAVFSLSNSRPFCFLKFSSIFFSLKFSSIFFSQIFVTSKKYDWKEINEFEIFHR